MKYLLLNLLMEAVKNDFWGEDSAVIDKYTEENGITYDENGEEQQLDCESINQYINAEGKAEIIIGNKKYFVSIEEQPVT